MSKPTERSLQLVALFIAGQVTDPAKTPYIAALVKNMPPVELPFVERPCTNCGRATAIDTTMLPIAEGSAGIICSECIQEISGKTMAEIVHDQLTNLTKGRPNA